MRLLQPATPCARVARYGRFDKMMAAADRPHNEAKERLRRWAAPLQPYVAEAVTTCDRGRHRM